MIDTVLGKLSDAIDAQTFEGLGIKVSIEGGLIHVRFEENEDVWAFGRAYDLVSDAPRLLASRIAKLSQ